MKIKRSVRWIALFVLLTGILPAGPVAAAPLRQGPFGRGAVVALRGTPHLWIADERGVLHWSGDTRALSEQVVDWGSRTEVTLDQLRGFQRGDPWLSAGLLKMGEPIYFPKWETSESAPTLLHIRSIADVELFGIGTSNYGALVLERAAWERRFGMAADSLPKGELAAATSSVAGSRERPIPRGTPVEMRDGWRITVTSTTPNATAAVLAANRFNDQPAPGRQFFIATVSVTRTGTTPGRFDRSSLQAVGPGNVGYVSYTDRCGVIPNELPTSEVFPGGTVSGNVCWAVQGSDVGTLVMYRTAGYGQEAQRLYFALAS